MKACRHKHYEIIYSPDDGGYYVECRDCWKQFEVKATQEEAFKVFNYDRPTPITEIGF